MAARRNTTKPAEPETVLEKVAEICRACWPHGWPHLSHSASCEHGTYVRDPQAVPAPDGEKATETTPSADGTKTEDAPPAGDKTGA